MALPYVICDVFTDRPLAGNQLAVFTDPNGLDPPTMQALAREMNFSETSFVLPPVAGGDARIRIFTPAREVPFAGHPTLGTAFVLGEETKATELRLETGAGVVRVALTRRDGHVSFGWMDQPLPRVEEVDFQRELLEALRMEGSQLPIALYDNGLRHVLVALASEGAVAAARPDRERLARLPGLAVSTFAGRGDSYKTRMFAPGAGVDEDPATGSAAGPLAYHLARHGWIDFGETIRISQGAEVGRPSVLYARAEGSLEALERVVVGGAAVIVARGEFRLPLS